MNKTVESKHNLVHRSFNSLGALRSRKRERAKVALACLALTTAGISVLAAALIFPSASRADDGDEVTTFDGRECTTFTVDVTQHLATNAQNDIDPSEGQVLFSRGDTY